MKFTLGRLICILHLVCPCSNLFNCLFIYWCLPLDVSKNIIMCHIVGNSSYRRSWVRVCLALKTKVAYVFNAFTMRTQCFFKLWRLCSSNCATLSLRKIFFHIFDAAWTGRTWIFRSWLHSYKEIIDNFFSVRAFYTCNNFLQSTRRKVSVKWNT